MAIIASQVVLHPVVSQSLKVGGTTLGRDKVNTLLRIADFTRILKCICNETSFIGLFNTLRVSSRGSC